MFKICVNCHRYIEKIDPKVFRVLNRWHHARTINSKSVEAVAGLLGIDQDHASNILKSYKVATLPTKDQIVAAHNICMEYGIDIQAIKKHPDLLRIQANFLEQRLHLYKDLGCSRVEPSSLLSHVVSLRATPNDLKEQKLLPPDANVVDNLLSCLPKPPAGAPPVERPSDDQKLETIHKTLLRHYFMWKLELTEDQLNRLMKTQCRFGHPSFTLLNETIDILLDEFEFGKLKIANNSFSLSRTPRRIRQLMEEIPKIANEDMKSIIKRYPRILYQQVEGLHEKLHVLRVRGVSDEAIARIPFILSLSSRTLAKRVDEFKSIPDFTGHWKNPRMLLMIFYFEGVKKHLQKLKELNIRFTSIHVLCACSKAFDKYTQFGSERTKSKDTLRFLADELEVDKDTVRTALKRNPLWCQIPFIYVQETWGLLKRDGFSNEAIFNNLPLLLHRSDQVRRYLRNMDFKRLDDPSKLTESRKLALCLYDIEKQYHFTGSGVWNCQHDETLLTRYQSDIVQRTKLRPYRLEIL